jgi:hypothetical protein
VRRDDDQPAQAGQVKRPEPFEHSGGGPLGL